ncbi:MAG TPA: VPDSG-CTERM sorting domain-containing protein [Verrucomicrobiae bacterium]|nr:VPDSG-CTERM sorting domain-containing protein [Verrucomicrobiae bacterium]
MKHSIVIAALALMATVPSALAVAPPPSVPDAGASGLLLAIACGGLMVVRRFVSKRD